MGWVGAAVGVWWARRIGIAVKGSQWPAPAPRPLAGPGLAFPAPAGASRGLRRPRGRRGSRGC
eukprot:358552-Chlamydomonas_euryale.AAC.1